MKFLSFALTAASLAATTIAFPIAARDASDADIARLAPDLGLKKGENPSGAGDCISSNINDAGQAIRIPCSCPPDRADFIAALQANVHAGHAVHNPTVKIDFPTDDSKESQLARITASSITIQNLEGPGVGCPIASTTLKKQAKAIEAGTDNTTASPAATTDSASSGAASTTNDSPSTASSSSSAANSETASTSATAVSTGANSSTSEASSTTSTASTSDSSPSSSGSAPSSEPSGSSSDASDDDIARLVPEFGVAQGQNPTGTGDCDGSGNASGQPIKIPCQCPPNRADFIHSLIANVRAGHVLKNPSITVTFPTDDSKASKQARLNTAAVTLQNFAGEGKGCPIAATTWKKLGQAIADGTDGSTGQATSTTASSTASTTATSTETLSTGSPSTTTTFSTDASSTTIPVASSTKSTSGSSTTDTPVDGTPSDEDVARLAPDLGGTAGVNPSGTGDCDGAVLNSSGKPIKVPCSCPPSHDAFIAALQANVRAGKAIKNPSVTLTFPVGDSVEDQLARINAAAITIQNLDGAGKGCPIAATTLGAQAQKLRTGKAPASSQTSSASTSTPTSSSATSSSTTTSSPSSSSVTDATSTTAAPSSDSTGLPDDALVARLAPELGWQAGVNPTGTGNCDGAVNGADGKPIQVPCSCPPAQDVYIAALQKNVRAGKAMNNPTVNISFPTDDSKDSQRARITAALITLQNLNGLGKGCPASATTLLKQQKALDAN